MLLRGSTVALAFSYLNRVPQRSSLLVIFIGGLCLLNADTNVRTKDDKPCQVSDFTNRNNTCVRLENAAFPAGLHVEPERVDFGAVTLGEVVVRYVRLRVHNSSVKVLKTTTMDPNVIYFLSSQTSDDGLPEYKIKIALIPKVIGILDSVLVIFTSFGQIPVKVFAQISPSPFRIFPIEHPRMPLRANFTTDVVLFNPFDEPLSVEQIYLSGGPVDIFLPETAHLPLHQRIIPRKKDAWEILPFQSRAIASLRMETLRPFHEKSFMRVKFNNTVYRDIFLPIDVKIWEDRQKIRVCPDNTKNMGTELYSVDGVLNFGVHRSSDGPVVLPLLVRLAENVTEVHVDSIIDGTKNTGIVLSVVQRTVSALNDSTHVANVTFCASNYTGNDNVRGEIVIKTKTEELVVPYRAFLISGDLIPSKESNLWHMPTDRDKFSVETLYIKNGFASHVTILKAYIVQNSAFSTLEISNAVFPLTIAPQEEARVVSVKVVVRSRLAHSATIKLITSLAVFDIPVHLYTGLLRIDSPFIRAWSLDGIVINEKSFGEILLHNENPEPVHIHALDLSSDCLSVVIFALCELPNNCSTVFLDIPGTVILSRASFLKVELLMQAPENEGLCKGHLDIRTNFQKTSIRLDLPVLPGRIELYRPEVPVILQDVFPSSYIERNLTIFSTFNRSIEVMNIFSEEFPTLRLMPNLNGIVIDPQSGLSFDSLTFDARELCKDMPGLCYVGFDLETLSETSETWKRPFRVISYSSVEIDRRVREKQLSLWRSISDGGTSTASFPIETSLKVTTSEKYVFYLPVTLNFIWPRTMITTKTGKIEFPLLTVGNSSELDVEVSNPADKPLFVHAYIFKDDKAQSWNRDIFYVKSITPKGTSQGYYNVDDERLPAKIRLVAPARGTAASVVPGSGQFLVRLIFSPQAEACYNALLYIRNNLTVIETIRIHGCGVEPRIRISNDSTLPGISSLVVKFSGKDAAAYCVNRSPETANRKEIKRIGKIAVTNTGGAYVAVDKVIVEEDNWYPSFAVLDTGPFVLAPKKGKRLSVEFDPDFGVRTKSGKIKVYLKDRTEPVVFEVSGQVDEKAIQLCHSIFGRGARDLRIRYIFFIRKWGWTFYFLPFIVFGLYIAFFRQWYTKRLKEEFLRQYICLIETRITKKSDLETLRLNLLRTSRSSEISDVRLRAAAAAAATKRKGVPQRVPAPRETIPEPQQVTTTVDENNNNTPTSLRESIEKEIPECLRELYCVAYYAAKPFMFFRHFPFPRYLVYRVFVVLEALAWPVRAVITAVVTITEWICGAFGYQLRDSNRINLNQPIFSLKLVEASGKSASTFCLTGYTWPTEWKWPFTVGTCASPATPAPSIAKPESSSLPAVPVQTNVKKPVQQSVSLNEIPSQSSSKKLFADVHSHSRTGTTSAHSRDQLVAPPVPTVTKQLVMEEKEAKPGSSRDSSLDDEDGNKQSSDEPDRQSPGCGDGNEHKSTRKLRRKQIQQAKRDADKAAKMAKNYNKTERKAQERKLVEAKTEQVLADDDGYKKGPDSLMEYSDPEVEREQLVASRRMAKLEAERLAAKAKAKLPVPPAPATSGGSLMSLKYDPFAPQNRPVSYPVQVEIIQQAFFKVEPKDNGLMFMEMDRDECLQLVKQLKRDNQNLFNMDPKAAVDMLLNSTRTMRYRINGEYVDLAKKATVVAYANSDRNHHEGDRDSMTSPGPGRRVSPPNFSRPNPYASMAPTGSTKVHNTDPKRHGRETRWSGSLSPNESENYTQEQERENRLSPMMSYADVASHPSASRRSSLELRTSAWRASPASSPITPFSGQTWTNMTESTTGWNGSSVTVDRHTHDFTQEAVKPEHNRYGMLAKLQQQSFVYSTSDIDVPLDMSRSGASDGEPSAFKSMFLSGNKQQLYGYTNQQSVPSSPAFEQPRNETFDLSNVSVQSIWSDDPFSDSTFGKDFWQNATSSPNIWSGYSEEKDKQANWTPPVSTTSGQTTTSFWTAANSIWSTSSFFQDEGCTEPTDTEGDQKTDRDSSPYGAIGEFLNFDCNNRKF